jgi:hypothetical protein
MVCWERENQSTQKLVGTKFFSISRRWAELTVVRIIRREVLALPTGIK